VQETTIFTHLTMTFGSCQPLKHGPTPTNCHHPCHGPSSKNGGEG
jgi:hypothetical protein